MRGPVVVVIVW